MSEEQRRKTNARFVRKPAAGVGALAEDRAPAEERSFLDQQALTRKNVLWSATLELMDNRSVECVITSISISDATIYLSQFANCGGSIHLKSPKFGTLIADVIDQDGKQVAVLLHDDARATIAKILTTMS